MFNANNQVSLAIDNWGTPPIRVRMNESFDELMALNPDLRMECTSTGEIVLMTPTGAESGDRNARIIAQLVFWAETHGGRVFDSSTLFQLPNGAKRSPDASWISDAKWQLLLPAQRKGFPPLCPELVVELRSETDRLVDLREKMVEYLQNGAQLGWLIDPLLKQVHVYRAGHEPQMLNAPGSLEGGPRFPGLTLALHRIWRES